MSLKHTVRNVARRFGYEVAKSSGLEEHAFVRHLAALFGNLDVQCVFDVGANRGQYRDFLRNRVGYRGLIVSFEPLSHNVALMREHAKDDPRWVVTGCALGSEDTHKDFNVMKFDNLSSFLSPDHSAVPVFRNYNVLDHRERVEVRRLDSVMTELREKYDPKNIYLKLDTQGFDLEVIRGAPTTLASVHALQTELPIRPIYANMPSYREVLEALFERKFAITGMFPVTRDGIMRVIEFDCVMLNSALYEGKVFATVDGSTVLEPGAPAQ